jgi:hypothetical protein
LQSSCSNHNPRCSAHSRHRRAVRLSVPSLASAQTGRASDEGGIGVEMGSPAADPAPGSGWANSAGSWLGQTRRVGVAGKYGRAVESPSNSPRLMGQSRPIGLVRVLSLLSGMGRRCEPSGGGNTHANAGAGRTSRGGWFREYWCHAGRRVRCRCRCAVRRVNADTHESDRQSKCGCTTGHRDRRCDLSLHETHLCHLSALLHPMFVC